MLFLIHYNYSISLYYLTITTKLGKFTLIKNVGLETINLVYFTKNEKLNTQSTRIYKIPNQFQQMII